MTFNVANKALANILERLWTLNLQAFFTLTLELNDTQYNNFFLKKNIKQMLHCIAMRKVLTSS